MRLLDRFTIKQEPIASIDLMERASRAFAEWVISRVSTEKKIGVVCGTGNNGGDGLCIARMLKDWGFRVEVWIVRGEMAESDDFKINIQKIDKHIRLADWQSDDVKALQSYDVIIDAIFGTGLSRAPMGIYRTAIETINAANSTVISVDVPSGLRTDEHSEGAIVQADITLTFQLPKLAFLLPQNAPYVGEWETLDIGLNRQYIENEIAQYFFLTKKAIRKIIQPRQKFSHKGTYGHALLIAGSLGKMGAAVLCARAALRAGAGLVTVHTPKCGVQIIQTAVPEAMVSIDEHHDVFSHIEQAVWQTKTVGIGPGLGTSEITGRAVEALLNNATSPMVIDADGLNLLSRNPLWRTKIQPGSILTPHPKELERLIGVWKNDFEKLEKAKHFASSNKSIVVIKGAYTAIVTPDEKVYFNSTGNPGMATAGSGDALTGILTALLAQGYEPLDAALAGVFLHGLSGDLAARDKGMQALIASDLVDYLSAAFRYLDR